VTTWNFQAPVGELGLGTDSCIRGEGDRVLCCVALVVTLYIEEGDRPEVRQAMLQALGRFQEVSGQALTWGMNPMSEEPEALPTDGALASVRRWPAAVFERFDFQMIFTGGKTEDDASPLRFVAVSRDREEGQLSFVSLSLPMSWTATHPPQAFLHFVLELANLLSPSHGYAGLGVVPHVAGFDSEPVKPFFDLARRFRGLEIEMPDAFAPFLSSRESIKGVNWLTVLGARWIAELGGASKIQPQLSEAISVFEYRSGVILQAGASPVLGDVKGGASLAAYSRVAAALAPVCIKTGMMMCVDPGGGSFDLAESERWLARFDARTPS
jgi:hypothetical protein